MIFHNFEIFFGCGYISIDLRVLQILIERNPLIPINDDHNNIIHFRHCHDLETCNKRLACRKYNFTFESRLFLKGNENEVELVIIAVANIKVIHYTNVSITGTIRRNLQRTTISYKHSIAHGEKIVFWRLSPETA
ncbi:hypothetical protein T02_9802 [Trichinella nativa]|uniref:Uncharacterized protein n=1 Tax=Trichinella nativa TaxID=6335 RepID=A0A0V1L1Z2_9BILA|nr:hypothetical protein T02_9802 [Trichinella nativa]